MFLAEITALRRVEKHKSVVQLIAYDARLFALYLDLVPGASLADPEWCSPGYRFMGDEKAAQRILNDMYGAIEHIHSRGVVHMDIKPANIIYDTRRGAVLIDFGHSVAVDPKDRATHLGGSPWYLPPEFQSEQKRGRPADIWALGVVGLYLFDALLLPDRPGNKGWVIADVHKQNEDGHRASRTMTKWLHHIDELRARLQDGNKGKFVWGMLDTNSQKRTLIDVD